mmetsp:Transcript_51190/g.117703  ORF Transcript_51190/g.117703 Transcript_51190/m.117703 type:complete len:225 (-) Transcript_51190:186-860(-)
MAGERQHVLPGFTARRGQVRAGNEGGPFIVGPALRLRGTVALHPLQQYHARRAVLRLRDGDARAVVPPRQARQGARAAASTRRARLQEERACAVAAALQVPESAGERLRPLRHGDCPRAAPRTARPRAQSGGTRMGARSRRSERFALSLSQEASPRSRLPNPQNDGGGTSLLERWYRCSGLCTAVVRDDGEMEGAVRCVNAGACCLGSGGVDSRTRHLWQQFWR